MLWPTSVAAKSYPTCASRWRAGLPLGLEKWVGSGRSRDPLLKEGAVAEAEDWLGLRHDELSAPEREFIEASIALRDGKAAPEAADPVQQSLQRNARTHLKNTTHSVLMIQVDDAIARADFSAARTLLRAIHELAKGESPARAMDPYIIQRLVLVTYKSKYPTELSALNEALGVLAPLEPQTSNDPETLGLSAAIHKRLWSLTDDVTHLDRAIRATDRGFSLGKDYYNGINLAFLLNARAARGRAQPCRHRLRGRRACAA